MNVASAAGDPNGWCIMGHLFDGTRRFCAVTQKWIGRVKFYKLPDASMRTANATSA